ncbi:magnesium transporter NIPA-domain-containing protein [Radiomyces spectabilis]|uniref:magnesium transporter NIPA-domain-containing protein n=1 Tax=Radiomyces spectabilis TaxID=64574 RepID=UPI00221FB129|nr:magnesium transporter NIPA-domain-containing protein [Radiomyces spectabilis]KAI8369650.1 magnesium transporter NIPA-domain-containing protein [Radiomyces spectabilis]
MSSNSTTSPFMGSENEPHGALYKSIGVTLAVASGAFIGSSFVFKKKGLLQSTERSGGVAGEGYGYLKSAMWWTGMILMVVGEFCNFVAYAFTPAILVTPLGALSVVISAVLSSIFLKEGLTFQGKVGCLQCVLGAIIIVLHAPQEGAADNSIETFKQLMLSIGFLFYAAIAVGVSLFLVFYCGPRVGNKNMLVYITTCSLIGSLSVVFTQGLGGAIVHSIAVENQFTNWFVYLVLVLTVVTLVVEIVYLNKALNIFNTALVTPTYYVIFTTLTIVSSTVFYRGFDASGTDITSCVFGFLIIVSGVALLHHSRSQPEHIPLNDSDSMEERHGYDNEKLMMSEDDLDDDDYQESPRHTTARASLAFSRRSRHSTDDYNSVDLLPASQQPYTETIRMNPVSSKNNTRKTARMDSAGSLLEQDLEIGTARSGHHHRTTSSPSNIPFLDPPPANKQQTSQASSDRVTAHKIGLKNSDQDEERQLISNFEDWEENEQSR